MTWSKKAIEQRLDGIKEIFMQNRVINGKVRELILQYRQDLQLMLREAEEVEEVKDD